MGLKKRMNDIEENNKKKNKKMSAQIMGEKVEYVSQNDGSHSTDFASIFFSPGEKCLQIHGSTLWKLMHTHGSLLEILSLSN